MVESGSFAPLHIHGQYDVPVHITRGFTATALLELLTDKIGRPFTVRDYQPEDQPKLAAMYADFEPKRVAQGLPPEGEVRIRSWLDRVFRAGRHLVVEVDGQLRGHLMLIPQDNGTTELANFLHQSIRNCGIGTELNALALRVAGDAGLRELWLSVEPANKPAIKSYEKAGFRRLPGSLWAPEIEMSVQL